MLQIFYKIIILLPLFQQLSSKKHVLNIPFLILDFVNIRIIYKTGDEIYISCSIQSKHPVNYYWQKDDKPLNLLALGIRQIPGEGTILIDKPHFPHEGTYQCFAKNELGTALSVKVLLKKAHLDSFPTIRDVIIRRPTIGQPLILPCAPPSSFPPGTIYWGENKNESKLRPIENNERISLDYKGNLYFSNINSEDSRNGIIYVCIVHNSELRSLVQGDDQKIEPQPGSLRHEPPKLMWYSGSTDIAIRGTTKRIKCIFSGYPTPVVRWYRQDGLMPSRVENEGYGQELVIRNVEFSDAGTYQCQAKNSESSPIALKDITITVESAPYWRNDRPPTDVNTSDEELANFDCQVNGVPKPYITWLINGIPLKDLPPNGNRKVGSNWLRYKSVTKSDVQVIQCNASNIHGYIFANAYLNVMAEKPSFIEAPLPLVKAAEGQTVELRCRSFGAPKPTIVWQKGDTFDDVMGYGDSRISILENGDLQINNIRLNDADLYQCYLVNKFGADVANGRLLVTKKKKVPTATLR